MSGLVKEQILNAIPALTEVEDAYSVVFSVARENLLDVINTLAHTCNYDALLDLTVVENPEEMVGIYVLMNLEDMDELRLEVSFSKEELWLPSLTGVFQAANVLERENYDFFGIDYQGHPNLKRILCPDDFVGHPLRKDYENHIRTK